MIDARKPVSATWSSNEVEASSAGTARLQLSPSTVGQDDYALLVVLNEAEIAEDLLRSADARTRENRRRCFDDAQLAFERPNAEGVAPLAAQLAERNAQVPGDSPLHGDPANPPFHR